MRYTYPKVTLLKITNSETDTIVALAERNVHSGVAPDKIDVDGDFWDSETVLRLAQELFAG